MNKYCIIIGRATVDPIAVCGPFDTEEEAQAQLAHYPAGHVDILIHPSVLEESRNARAPSNN